MAINAAARLVTGMHHQPGEKPMAASSDGMVFALLVDGAESKELDFDEAVETLLANDPDRDPNSIEDQEEAFAELEAAFWSIFLAEKDNPFADANPSVGFTDETDRLVILSPLRYDTESF